MKESEIINTIENIRHQFKSYKDGGISFVEYLAQTLLNTVDEDKKDVFNFFLDEIKLDKYGFFSIAIQTIIEMKAEELSTQIEKIYNENRHLKDENWQYSIIVSLMKLKYTKSEFLYSDFVNSYLEKQPNNAFFLLVQYCNVDPEKAIPLLSKFYIENWFRNEVMSTFLYSRIGFLVTSLIDDSNDNLSELVKLTYYKNNKIGLHLRNCILNFLSSSMTIQYSSELINAEIEKIMKFKI